MSRGAAERLFPLALRLCLLAAATLLVLSSDRGLDLTDESYYLAWISDPSAYAANIHPFGPPLHLVFEALGRSVAALRIFGAALLMASGAALGLAFERYYRGGSARRDGAHQATAGALFALSYYALWILTPSYNLLANASGAFVLAGIMVWFASGTGEGRGDEGRKERLRDPAGSVLVGFGGCLAFFGKATLGALGAVVVLMLLAWTLWRHGWRRALARAAVAAAACLIPLLAGIVFAMPLAEFVQSIRTATETLEFGNALPDMPGKAFAEIAGGPPYFFAAIAALAVTVLLVGRGWRRPSLPPIAANGAVMAYAGYELVSAISYSVSLGLPACSLVGIPTISLVAGQIGLGVAIGGREAAAARVVLPLVALLLLPFATAFGTANNLMNQTGVTLYPALLASSVAAWLFFRPGWARLTQLLAAAGTVALLVWSSFYPYGLPRPVLAQTEPVTVPFASGTLRVDPETQDYVEGLKAVAASEGLSPDAPVMDLSGGGPGTALVLNQGAPFHPWLVHIFPSSGDLVDHAWSSLDEAGRRAAWVVGPVDPNLASSRFAQSFEARKASYRLAATLPMIFWGQEKLIEIWVPREPAAGR